MHPDLLNNSIFLKYYNQWQEDPTSIVFAAIAEYLQAYGMTDEAIKVSLEGLKHHPQLVSGRLALAKAYISKKEETRAKEELRLVLNLMPDHSKALELMQSLGQNIQKPIASWETVTMAKIYAAQGHKNRAKEVYEAILAREPANQEALRGLSSLESEG